MCNARHSTAPRAGIVHSLLVVALLAAALGCAPAARAGDGPGATAPSALPLWFEPAGAAADADFVVHGPVFTLRLQADGPSLAVATHADPVHLGLEFVGAASRPTPRATRPLPGVSHYYLAGQTREHVPHFGEVRYDGVYPGVDVVFHADQRALEYDVEIAPGADPSTFGLRLRGATGVQVDADGALVARVGRGAIKQRPPVAYQVAGGERRSVPVRFVVDQDVVRFAVGEYDHAAPLVIDPIVVVFGTLLGGSSYEMVEYNLFAQPLASAYGGLATDAQGNVYVAGTTQSSFPLGAGTALSNTDVFVAKLDAAGSTVAFVTYVGGAGVESHPSLALDSQGAILVAGYTQSPTFCPAGTTSRAFKTQLAGVNDPRDGFLVRLDTAGTPNFCTYIGGTTGGSSGAIDSAEAIAASGTKAVVVGYTDATDFPVTGSATQANNGGFRDGWLSIIDPDGSPANVYSTYMGGTSGDAAFSVAVDPSGRILVAGQTASPAASFAPTATAFQPALSGLTDAFVARYSATGALDYRSYFGGSAASETYNERAKVAVDAAGRVYLAGVSVSTDLPVGTNGPGYQPTTGGGADAFVAKLNLDAPANQQLVYRTYLGGSGDDFALSLVVDGAGRATVGGLTQSANFPTAAGLAGNPTFGGLGDGFITRLSASGAAIDFSTFVGGANDDSVLALALHPSKGLYAVGYTESAAPLALQPEPGSGGTVDTTLGGVRDAFVARFDVGPTVTAIAPASGVVAGGTPVTITGTDFASGSTVTIGGTAATGITFVNATTIQAVTPAGTLGARDVVVTGPAPASLSSTLTGGFTYVSDTTPTITSVTPSSGSVAGGQTVTITGTKFANGATVKFGGVAATNVVVNSAASLSARTPAGAAAGAVAVTVTNPNLEAGVLPNGYTYAADFDGDGMPDAWEATYGLDPTNPADKDLDPDRDGASNLKEFTDGTNPTTAHTLYFAEGATISIFSTRIALLNDDASRTATAVLDFLTSTGAQITDTRTLPPLTRRTVLPKTDVTGLAAAQFSTAIRSNLPIVADRTMTWDERVYGAHAETAVAAPSATWYLAEGATIGGFNLFYLIQNPNDTAAAVTVRYLLASGAPVEKTYTVDARSRSNIWVNTETAQGVSLNNQQLSAVFETAASTPVIVERAMYLDAGGLTFGAGHESAAVTAPATRWFLAEGATGPFFDLFVLVANPNPTPTRVTATYLRPSGAPLQRTYDVAANSRYNIWVNLEPGLDTTAVSTIVEGDQPIIVERAMWWPHNANEWYEAHNSPGATATGTRWLLAEGEVGAPGVLDTFILLANASAALGTARVTLIFEDGTAPVTKDFTVPANSRQNVWVGQDIGTAALVGKRFGAVVESVGATPADLVVERAMYWTSGGQVYAAGTNALATKR